MNSNRYLNPFCCLMSDRLSTSTTQGQISDVNTPSLGRSLLPFFKCLIRISKFGDVTKDTWEFELKH
jgi:hypothetical protein